MKAVIYNRKSSSERLTFLDVEKPVPGATEILVEIHTTSINAADYRMMRLGFPPKKKIFGADISGVVVSAGTGVRKFKPGDHVIGDLSDFGFGGFAEYVAAPEKAFIMKPDQLSFTDAAALPLAGLTALQAVRDKGGTREGMQVLIIGCSGGVGSFAVQLAKHYGAKVTGVCSSKNLEQSRLLGADYVVDYTMDDFTKTSRNYDLILAVNGSYSLSACRRILKPHGRYIMVGGSYSQVFKSVLFSGLLSVGSRKMSFLAAKSNTGDLETLVEFVDKGIIKPQIDKSFSLDEVPEAFRYFELGLAKGKLVITI